MDQGAFLSGMSSLFANEGTAQQSKKVPYILVVDDDPIFGRILQRVARKRGAELAFVCSYKDFRKVNFEPFDVLIMDYFLDSDIRGTALAEECHGKPVVLVSRSQNWLATEVVPESVQNFVHKKFGADAIIDVALTLSESLWSATNQREELQDEGGCKPPSSPLSA